MCHTSIEVCVALLNVDISTSKNLDRIHELVTTYCHPKAQTTSLLSLYNKETVMWRGAIRLSLRLYGAEEQLSKISTEVNAESIKMDNVIGIDFSKNKKPETFDVEKFLASEPVTRTLTKINAGLILADSISVSNKSMLNILHAQLVPGRKSSMMVTHLFRSIEYFIANISLIDYPDYRWGLHLSHMCPDCVCADLMLSHSTNDFDHILIRFILDKDMGVRKIEDDGAESLTAYTLTTKIDEFIISELVNVYRSMTSGHNWSHNPAYEFTLYCSESRIRTSSMSAYCEHDEYSVNVNMCIPNHILS